MARVRSITDHQQERLNRRRAVTVELPEFAIRALQHRVELANAEAGFGAEDRVTFNDVVECHIISPLSVGEMPFLEDAVPGFTGALARWLFQTTYHGSGG